MFRRLTALLLIGLLAMAGALAATEEADGLVIEGDIGPVEGPELSEPEIVDMPDVEISELSAGALNAGILANAPEQDEDQPIELSVKKSVTRSVTLGLCYQIVIPGKKIKRCTSSDKKIASVTKQGLIETKKVGTVKITVTPKKGSRLVLKLKVKDPKTPTAVTINEGSAATMAVGQTMQLSAAVTPDTAPQQVAWKSSDGEVASVGQDGLVTALAVGTAKITAATDNGLEAAFKVTVRRTASGHYMISHAMGGIDGYNYSNCLEGFLENYQEGHRIFEVDMEYTSDGKLVLWHDWGRKFCSKYKKGRKPTYDEFMGSRIFDEYTPMDVERLLKLMDEYPDVRVVTDTKYTKTATVKKQFKTIVSTARELGISDVLDRLVVEIYSKEMFKTVEGVHHFNEYMVTLYKAYKKAPSSSQLKSVAKFCKKNGIATVAMYAKWWKPKYAGIIKPYGLDIALYTVNNERDAEEFFDEGVTALFTDFLPPV